MLEFIAEYPWLIALLFSVLFAGIGAALVGFSVTNTRHLDIYVSSAMISTAFWAPIVATRIADRTKSCSYFRAALLGAIAALLAVLFVGFPMDAEVRLDNMFKGLASLPQTIKYIVVDDFAANLGCGVFTSLLFGWYLVPIGAIAGLLLRELRKLYQAEPPEAIGESHEGYDLL